MATKKANKKTTKVVATSTVDNVIKTAASINKEMQNTAEVVAKEVTENGKAVKAIAEKAAKELTKKVGFDSSMKKIKSTTKNINIELKTVATDVADVVLKRGQRVTGTAKKAAKDAMVVVNVGKGVKNIASTAKNINEYSLKTADQAIDSVFENGEKWQKIAKKAVNGGLKLAEKNQEIVFGTLETVKGQLITSAGRFRELFSKN